MQLNLHLGRLENAIIMSLIASMGISLLSNGVPLAAHAQQQEEDITGLTREQIIESRYSGPVFLDSYWTSGSSSNQNHTEVQVSPGDGSSTLAVVLINRGPSDIAGITGRLTLPNGFTAIGESEGAPAVATYNQVAKVGDTLTLYFDVDVPDSVEVGKYTARLSVDYSKYFETGAPRNVEMDVPILITGEPLLTASAKLSEEGDQNKNSRIVAGKVEDYSFTLANEGTSPITNVVVTIESSSESLEILGDSKWTIPRIAEGSQIDLAIQVFASEEMIGDPASFDVTVTYSSNGESKSDEFMLGVYVDGEITLRIYDVKINNIGGAQYLVGNILNEGNVEALFATIELVPSSSLPGSNSAKQLLATSSAPVYLGELSVDSPIPINIPINLSNVTLGPYSYNLKVTYKDNLRNVHEFVTSGNIVLEEPALLKGQFQQQPIQRSGGAITIPSLSTMLLPIIIVASFIAAAVAAVLIIRKKRAKEELLSVQNKGQVADSIETILGNRDVSNNNKKVEQS